MFLLLSMDLPVYYHTEEGDGVAVGPRLGGLGANVHDHCIVSGPHQWHHAWPICKQGCNSFASDHLFAGDDDRSGTLHILR